MLLESGKRGEGWHSQKKYLAEKKILNLAKYVNLQIQEDKQTSNSINLKKCTPRHVIVKFLKTEYNEKILKADRKTSCLERENNLNKSEFLIRNDKEGSGTTFFKC